MVSPKKHLGQHFLTDKNIAKKIVDSLTFKNYENVLEVGPGKGILTQFILQKSINAKFIEIDKEAVEFLKSNFSLSNTQIINQDFLEIDLSTLFEDPFAIIGNFPYNISSQIIFKILDNRGLIREVVGMFQKEVAERIVARPMSKVYGILSVLTQAYYDVKILFTINEGVFFPKPKVKSAVILMQRKTENLPQSEYEKLKYVVKTAFQQRRKMLRNSLSQIISEELLIKNNYDKKRPEELSFEDFDRIALSLNEFTTR